MPDAFDSYVKSATTGAGNNSSGGDPFNSYIGSVGVKRVVSQPVQQQPIQQQTQPPQIQQPQTIGNKISDIFGNIKQGIQNFGQEISQKGLVGALAPKDQTVEQYVINKTYNSPEQILTQSLIDATKKTVDVISKTPFAVSGSAIKGLQEKMIIGKDNLTPYEKYILQGEGYLDQNGNIKVGKTVAETAKNALSIALMTPQAFAAEGLIGDTIFGSKILNIGKYSIPLQKVLAGVYVDGAFSTLYTPNLDKVFSDPEVMGDAYRRYAAGVAIGTLLRLPLSAFKNPGTDVTTEVESLKGTKNSFKTLPPEQQIELKVEFNKASMKYHSDMPLGSDSAFKEIVKHRDALDIAWLKQLNEATPEEAQKLLAGSEVVVNAPKITQNEAPKAPNVPETKPASPAVTTTPKVPETPAISRKVILPTNLPPEVTGKSITIRPDGTASFNLEVAQEARGKGIGAQAVKTMEETIAKAGATKIQLPVKEESVGFFEKQGYTVTGPAKNGIVPMEKTLNVPTTGVEEKLFRGSKGAVVEETKKFNKVLYVKGYQPQLLEKLASEGNTDAQIVLDDAKGKKIDFVSADKVIREALQNKYDAVRYDNSTDNRGAIGVEFHDLKNNKFYAVNKETASAYSRQNRGGKYETAAPSEAEQMKKIEKQVRKESSVMNNPNVEQYSEVLHRAIKTYNLNKAKGIDDIATMEKKIHGLDQAIQAITDAGYDVQTMEDLKHIVLQSTTIPGLSQFSEQDLVPKGKELLGGVKQLYDEISTWFNPVSKAPAKATDIIMLHKGEMERQQFRAEKATKKLREMWDKQPEDARFEFMNKVETGQSVPEQYKGIADLYRDRLNNAHIAASQFKDINFLESFFPHFWKQPDKVANGLSAILGRRPLQGSKSFLKQRVFQTIDEGRHFKDKNGKNPYELVSTNPEELLQIYEQNVRKFVMAQNIKADMTEKGFWKFVRPGSNVPTDFTKIDDNIVNVYYPKEVATVMYGDKEGEQMVKAGEYYAQKDVARLINNYLSKDFIYDTAVGKGLMNIKNTMNAFELGFSAFHLTAETLDAVTNRIATGLAQLESGRIFTGLVTLAKAPLAPYSFFRAGQKFYNGDPELLAIEKDIFTGGASLKERQYYKSTVFDTFNQNLRSGNLPGALIRLPLAAIEGTMRPLFNYYIPRLKIGAFREVFSDALITESKAIQDGTLSRETLARDVWNNIENRMGELNYDNLFWNKNLKTSMMLTFRAVGWNLGTARELGGAVPETVKSGLGLLRGKGFKFTRKMNYTLALIFLTGTLGAIYQYLHTGKKPESIKDLFYPRNGGKDSSGNDTRVEFPTYLKDIYQFSHDPVRTIGNKLSPVLSTIISLLENKDYYDDYIRNENDVLPLQAKQTALYLLEQFKPFSIQQVGQFNKGTTTPLQNIESFLGMVKAPKGITQSDWEKTMQVLYENQMGGHAPRTPEQKEIADMKVKAREEIKNGNYTTLWELINNGTFTTSQGVKNFISGSVLTGNQRMFKSLSKENKVQVLQDIYGNE